MSKRLARAWTLTRTFCVQPFVEAPVYSLFLVFLAGAVFLLHQPLIFPKAGIDPSWLEGMNQFVVRKLAMGKDVVFTYGPFSRIHTGQYHPRLFLGHCVLLGLMSVLCVGLLHRLAAVSIKSLLLRALLFAALLPLIGAVDVYWYLFQPLGLLVFIAYRRPNDDAFEAFFWFGMAVVFLTKSSLGLSTLFLWGFFLVWSLLQRRFRWPLAAYPVFVALLWLQQGQHLGSLPYFVKNTFPIGSGYGEAMGRPVRTLLLIPAYWCALALAAATLFVGTQRVHPLLRDRLVLSAGFLVLGLSLFKGTFVADYLNTAMVAVLTISAFVWVACWSELQTRLRRVLLGASLLASLAATQLMSNAYYSHNVFSHWWVQTKDALALVSSNLEQHRRQDLEATYEAGRAAIRKRYPLPALTGSIDVYRTNQAIAFAHDLDWNPRLVLQSYSVYTPWLLEQNLQHLRGDRRPDNLLVELATIDGRYPMLDDGISLLEILSRYGLVRLHNDVALFKRRPQPIPYEFGSEQRLTTPFGTQLRIRNGKGRLDFVRIEFKKSLAGRLASTLYRAPIVFVTVTLANGKTKPYRVNGSQTETGFLLSPLVINTRQYALLNDRNAQRAPKSAWVTAVQFDIETGFDWMYENEVSLRLAEVTFASQDEAVEHSAADVASLSRRAWAAKR